MWNGSKKDSLQQTAVFAIVGLVIPGSHSNWLLGPCTNNLVSLLAAPYLDALLPIKGQPEEEIDRYKTN